MYTMARTMQVGLSCMKLLKILILPPLIWFFSSLSGLTTVHRGKVFQHATVLRSDLGWIAVIPELGAELLITANLYQTNRSILQIALEYCYTA